jgi:ATP-dependent RNA helicase RhlE
LTQFTDLGLDGQLLKALAAKGYSTPTPIQAQAIPPVLAGRDLLGIAQTGTGKTAAFALPILHRLVKNPRPAPRKGARCIVLAPTRELATQIADSFKAYGKHLNLKIATVFGGVKYGAQIKALAGGLDVLVATPGRLIDHMQNRDADVSTTEILVLDEADQMLDLGFLQPIKKIVSRMVRERQNLFFSATMPTEIGKLAAELLKDPAQVSVTPESTTVEKIDQRLLFIEAPRKRVLLAELFEDAALKKVLVFTRTKRGADRVAQFLDKAGIGAAAIHGDKSQGQREKALAAFKQGQVRALIATDIAARGIDVSEVSHVVQYELPQVPEAYVHRIGRTARAGSSGCAIAFCADDERNLLKDIQRTIRMTIPSFDRRNDRGLAVMHAATEHLPSAEQSLPASKPKNRNRRRGGQNGGGERPQGHGHNPREAAQKPHGNNGGQRNRGQGGKRRGGSNSDSRPAWNPLSA